MSTTPVADRLTVGTVAVAIDTEGAAFWDGTIIVRSVASVYVGMSGVTTGTGVQLDTGQQLRIQRTGAGPQWYLIAGSAGCRVDRIGVAG